MHLKSRGLGEVQANLLLAKTSGAEGESYDGTNSQDTWVPPWFHHKLTVGLQVSPSPLEMQSLTLGLEVARESASLLSTTVMESRVLAGSPQPFPF